MMASSHIFITELLEDIETGRVIPLTSVKNIESILKEFVDEYSDYDVMLKDLEEWNYVKLL